MKKFVITTLIFMLAVIAVCGVLLLLLPYNPDGYILAEKDKIGMLRDTDRPKSVVLLGGSTVAFGYDSEMVERETGWNTINAGLHASLGMKCILDEAVPYLRRGDILVFVPEIDQFYDNLPYGELEFADWTILSGLHSADKLNARQWWNLAVYLPMHLRRRLDYTMLSKAGKLQPSIYRRSSFNSHGDMVAHWNDSVTVYKHTGFGTELVNWNDSFFNYYLEILDSLSNRGVKVLIVPTPLAESEYKASKKQFDYAINKINESRHPYAVPYSEYVMPDSMFYDTPYHLRRPGAEILSHRLSELLNESGCTK